MDLDYLSEKEPNPSVRYSHYDKFYKSLQMSVKQLPLNPLSKRVKSKLYRILEKDTAYKLSVFLNKQAIAFDCQIGPIASQWNILHICMKLNSIECLQYILKAQFQEYQQGYTELVNSKTIQGYTPLMVAIITKAHCCLEYLLACGGVDIHVVDKHKMTASDIAINYHNENAINLLMTYQKKSQKKIYLNANKLSEPIIFKQEDTFCDRVILCLISCLSCGFLKEEDDLNQKATLQSRISNIISNPVEVIIDHVKLDNGYDLSDYEIEWRRAMESINSHQIMLFESFNPFYISEKNFTIPNNLIIFQCITQHPSLVRKLITYDKTKPNWYNVQIYPNQMMHKITIDDYIPFIKDRNQPMFLSDSMQLWPMLVQKALAKYHDGYFNLGKISAKKIMEQLTGTYTKIVKISQMGNVMNYLQNLSSKGYLHVLVAKRGSSLCTESNLEDCFSVLNFYEKGDKKMILINCAYIIDQWKQKEVYEQLPMKILKSHCNNHNQMSVWIDANQIQQHFTHLIVSYTMPNFQRSQIKFKARKYLFFKFRIEQNKFDDMFLTLYDANTHQVFNLNSIKGWRNQGVQQITINDPQPQLQNLAYITQKQGQYFCKFQFDDFEQRNFTLVCWSSNYVQLQFIEEQFAIVEWFGCLKKNYKINWDQQKQFILQRIGDLNFLMVKRQFCKKVLLKNFILKLNVIDGHYTQAKQIQLIKQSYYYYCVFRATISQSQLIIQYE